MRRAVAAGLVLALPASAQAATKTVYVGPPPAIAKALGQATGGVPVDANAFFPRSVTVHPGDKVKFVPAAAHKGEVPARRKPAASPFVRTSKPAAETDAAGAPFWFDGKPRLRAVAATAKPATITFAKRGRTILYGSRHPGMKVTVTVKRGKIPGARQDLLRVAAQGNAAVKVARQLVSKPRPSGAMALGDAGKGGVEVLAFLPDAITVPVGTTVTFAAPVRSVTPFTATTGSGPGLAALRASLTTSAILGAATYPSDPPPNPAALTPTLHGDGFWNSGLLAAGATRSVTFAAAGTYTFHDLLHPSATGMVTVR